MGALLLSKPRISPRLLAPLVAAPILLLGSWLVLQGQGALLLAGMLLPTLLAVYKIRKQWGIYLAIGFLIVLGDVRRIVALAFGFPNSDPLILVGPIFVALIAVPALIHLRLSDLASKFVFGVFVIAVLQIFNPGQGGVVVGLSGALIYLPPLLWFWVGRTMGNEQLVRTVLYRLVLPLAILAALIGYYQVYVGFLPWQTAWVEHVRSSYMALYIGGQTVRAFGYSVASSEYSNLLLLACMVSVAGFIAGKRAVALALIPLLPALVLASSRGAILRLLVSGSVAWALKGSGGGIRIVRLVAALCIGVAALLLILSRYGDYGSSKQHSAAGYALAHQAAGLSHPLDQKYSTAGVHTAEIVAGFAVALRHPIGYGIGYTNIAASKYGVGGVASEFDISDAFLSLGLPGGLLFLGMILSLLGVAVRYTRSGAPDLALPIASMLFPMLGNWMFPGEYSSGAFYWLLIGSMVGIMNRQQEFQNRRFVKEDLLLTEQVTV